VPAAKSDFIAPEARGKHVIEGSSPSLESRGTNCKMCLYHLGILGISAPDVYILSLIISAGAEKCRRVVSFFHISK